MFANIIPANIIWGHLFKFPWWFTSVFTGCLALFVVPWYLTTSGGFYSFMNVYGSLLGPLAGIMITDYLIIRKGKYNMRALYNIGDQYAYRKGVNMAGIAALVFGSLLAMLKLNLSAMIGIVAGGLIYYVAFKYFVAPKFPQAEIEKDYVMDSPESVLVKK